MREKRVTIATWFIAGALAMYFEAKAIAVELRDFPGGPAAMARSIMPTIEGMRILRWPADRLDTLGGYLTYHNVTLFNYFLALFAALQGAKLLRHLEEERTIDFFLATGISRARLIALRSVSYGAYQILISLGLGIGTALALATSDEPNTSGAIITLLAGGICIFPFFGLGLLLSQFSRSSRLAAGLASILVTVVYVVGNIADKYTWLRWFTSCSPFHYANLSKPVVPGFGTDYWSWVAMIAVGTVLIVVSILCANTRDLHAVVRLVHRPPRTKAITVSFVPRTVIGDLLWRQRYGLLAWAVATSAFIGVFVSMMNGIVEIWQNFDFLQQFADSGFGTTPQQQYLAMVYEILPPFIAGFVVAQSAKWTSDLSQGRVQYYLSTPMSPSGLIVRRVVATLIGAEIMIVSAMATAIIGTVAQGADLDGAAVGRVAVMANVFTVSFASLCAALVSLLRGRNATQVLSIYVGAAWLIVFMAPYLNWPLWTVHLSVFDALAHPFVGWPTAVNLSIMAATSVIGLVAATQISERSPAAM